MTIDLNDAEEQRVQGELIPDGTFVKLKGTIRPGGNNCPGADEMDAGLFKQSASSDAVMLDWEFVILHGKYAKRKLWQLMTVYGGKVDEKGHSKAGNISKAMLRAMIDSALGLDPKDMSEATKAKRVLRGFQDFDGIEFAALIGVEKGGEKAGGGNYPDKNRITRIVVPSDPEWQAVMSGQEVEPKPTGAVSARSAAPHQQSKPAWGASAAPATNVVKPSWGNNTAASPTITDTAADPAAGPAWMRG
jgi:hypothetical protein